MAAAELQRKILDNLSVFGIFYAIALFNESQGLEAFICGFLGGAMGFFNFPGWLLIYFGWVNTMAILMLCLGAGLFFGGFLVYGNAKNKHRIRAAKSDQRL